MGAAPGLAVHPEAKPQVMVSVHQLAPFRPAPMQVTYQIRDEIVSAKWRDFAMLNFWNFDAAF
jgi:hypothetical protein